MFHYFPDQISLQALVSTSPRTFSIQQTWTLTKTRLRSLKQQKLATQVSVGKNYDRGYNNSVMLSNIMALENRTALLAFWATTLMPW